MLLVVPLLGATSCHHDWERAGLEQELQALGSQTLQKGGTDILHFGLLPNYCTSGDFHCKMLLNEKRRVHNTLGGKVVTRQMAAELPGELKAPPAGVC